MSDDKRVENLRKELVKANKTADRILAKLAKSAARSR